MLNGKSGLAMMPFRERRAGASATFAVLSATSPFPGDHRACGSRLVKVPAFVLMRVEGWNRKKKGVKRPSVSTEGQITEESAPPRGPGRGFAGTERCSRRPNHYQRVCNSGTV
jgi:hypothetical protein